MKNNSLKLFVDILMSVAFALLFNTHVFTLPFHEVLGIGIGFGIFVHFLFNLQWVKKISLKLFDPRLPGKTRLGYGLNLLLLISFILIIVSGIFISKILFPNLHIGNESWFRALHISISYVALALVGIHIGLHWKWLMSFFSNLFKIKSSMATGIAAKLLMIILLLFGGYQIVATNYTGQIANISSVLTMSNPQNIHDGFQRQFGGITDNSQQHREGRGSGFDHSSLEGRKGQFQSPNLLSVLGLIVKYSGIMSLFAVLTYYVEKYLIRRTNNV